MRTFSTWAILAVICLSLTMTPARGDDGSNYGGFGNGREDGSVNTSASANGSSITIKLDANHAPGANATSGVSSGGLGVTANGAPWDPDKDAAFQKALRNALMSNDDSIFFNSQLMDTAKNRTTYGLQDPCIDDKGSALTRCRTSQECTDDSGAKGVNMDVVVGGTGDGQRSARGTQMCVAQGQAEGADDEGYVPLPVFTLQDFQQLAVAPAENHAQPAPDTLKNMNTNVYAVAQPQTFETTLGGYPVSVRAYPVQYTWNYGDGSTLGPTPLTGAPLADGEWDVPTDTSHVYTATGDYSLTLTTSFYGEYNIAGTGWQPVNGYNQVTSPPVALTVWRATVHNVADDCLVNPAGLGCPGGRR